MARLARNASPSLPQLLVLIKDGTSEEHWWLASAGPSIVWLMALACPTQRSQPPRITSYIQLQYGYVGEWSLSQNQLDFILIGLHCLSVLSRTGFLECTCISYPTYSNLASSDEETTFATTPSWCLEPDFLQLHLPSCGAASASALLVDRISALP